MRLRLIAPDAPQGGACPGKGCTFLPSARRIARSVWRTPAGEPGPEPDPAAWVAKQREVVVDNLAWPFNLLICEGLTESPNQIARKMVYVLR